MFFDTSKHLAPKLIKIIMSVATLLAILFIGLQFSKQWPVISQWDFSTGKLLFIIALAVLYGLNLFFLAQLWFRLMVIFEPESIDQKEAFGIYARVQIGKYIPGNIWQFAGRHIYLNNYNITHKNILKANFLEILAMLLAATIVAVVFFPFGTYTARNDHLIIFILVLVAIVIAIYAAKKFSDNSYQAIKKSAPLVAFPLIFFLVQSGIFTAIGIMMGWEFSGLLMFTAAVSWVIGFVVPGAPGGIGVRELVIYSLLQSVHPESEILIVLTLFRVVTVLGDILCALIGARIKVRTEKKSPQ